MPENVPLTARAPLRDAQWAVQRLEATDDATEFRVLWAATAALLRTVGHVLDKVDGEASPALRTAVDTWWREVKRNRDSNPIFWQFIEQERNNVLKEYRLGYVEGDVTIAADGQTYTLESPIYKPLASPFFNFEDARDIAVDAIEWWDRQLRSIENSLGPSEKAV
jgi:hypothetical protein